MADNLQVSAKISEEKSVNILTLSVVRRDGAITPFKSDKISNAIKKAFLALFLCAHLIIFVKKVFLYNLKHPFLIQ